jgi:O-antigen/teichoic acid export membrane protein
MILGHGSRILLQGLYFILLARALGAEGFGSFAGALALVTILAPFSGWGAGNILIMRVARDPAAYPLCIGNALLTIAVSGSALILVALGINHWLLSAAISWPVLLMIAFSELLFYRFAELVGQAFQAFERLAVTARVFVLTSALRLAAVIGFLALSDARTVEAWVWWYAGATLISSALSLSTALVVLGRPRFAPSAIPSQFREGFFFSLGIASKSVYTDIDKTMLLRLTTAEITGIYTAAYRVITMAFTPVHALLSAAYAKFFRAGESGIKGSLGFALRLMPIALGYGLIVGVAMFLAAPLLPLVLGSDFQASVNALRWLAFLPFIQSFHYLLADALTGAGLQGWRSTVQVVIAVLNAILNLWLIPLYSWQGAALATLICEGIMGLLFVVLISQRYKRA